MSKNPTIAIIKVQSNGEKHPGIDSKMWDNDSLNHYKLKDEIKDYIEFTKINTIYELFDNINNIICPSDKYIVNIEDIFYTSEYVYQAIFKCVSKEINTSYVSLIEDSNKLATQILGERHAVDGNMILIKRSIYNNNFDYVDINFEDIKWAAHVLRRDIVFNNFKANEIINSNRELI